MNAAYWSQFAGQWVVVRRGRHIMTAPTAREVVHRLRKANATGAVAWYEPSQGEVHRWRVVHADGKSGANDLFHERADADRWAASWGAVVEPYAWKRPAEAGAS